jgi:hypothetical protein
MALRNVLPLIVVLAAAGCSSTGGLSDPETQARRRMAIADTLERASALKEATLEYTIVAERFSGTSVHAAAVRKAALLYSSSANPAANDSSSRYWLTRYLDLTRSAEEKQIIRMYMAMVDRVALLRDSVARQTVANDSLSALARRQTGDLTTRAKRMQELEAELQKASDELKRLKEIDVRVSRSRGKNKH